MLGSKFHYKYNITYNFVKELLRRTFRQLLELVLVFGKASRFREEILALLKRKIFLGCILFN